MSRNRIAFIGQKRVVSGLSGYQLGDAQIDAQNRAGDQMAQIIAAYTAQKNAGTLTASYINGAINGLQQAVATYKATYYNTSRGKAGGDYLQGLVNGSLVPPMQADLAALTGQPAPVSTGGFTAIPMDNSQPFNAGTNPSTVVNINAGATDAGAINAMQPSASPGAPSGIQIPGYETTVHASLPSWYEDPKILIALGIVAFLVLRQKNS